MKLERKDGCCVCSRKPPQQHDEFSNHSVFFVCNRYVLFYVQHSHTQ